ncbi:MAG TPA: hypothetical protein DEO38_03705 [Bacteroidales bacterium]|nr:hypothetical protein [Bacteroidales bacterium]
MKTKFYFPLLLIGAMLISFVGCNDEKDSPKPGPIIESQDPSGSDDPTNGPDVNSINSVSQMLSAKAPDKDAGTQAYWVEAYIVGYYNFDADPKFIIGAEGAKNAQILIADNADIEQSVIADKNGQLANIMAVKLEAGMFRTKLNLADNPGNYKKKVKIHGVFEMYCGVKGLVKIDEAEIDGVTIKPAEIDVNVLPESSVKTIAEVNGVADSEDVFYTITGQITEITNAEYGNLTLKDETGSIIVYGITSKYIGMGQNSGIKNDKSFGSLGLVAGDIIKISGTKTTFNNAPEFTNAYFIEKVGHEDVEVEPVTPITDENIVLNVAMEASSFIAKEGEKPLTTATVSFADGVVTIAGDKSNNNLRLHVNKITLPAGDYIWAAKVKAESAEAKARVGYQMPDPADATKNKFNYDKAATTLAAGADYVEIRMEFTLTAETEVSPFVANNGKTGNAILVNEMILAKKAAE